MTIKLRVISLGAGVQSTCMALMAAHGEIGPMPDCAIFADTGWEPRKVYEHLDWLEKQLPFPVHRVSAGNIRNDIISGIAGRRVSNPPFFTAGQGFLNRSCTRDYKINPILKKIRELAGFSRGPRSAVVEQWLGISTDEASRMKPSRVAWCQHRWPLIDARMSRWNCLRWMERNGYPQPPKSACIGCPYHSDNAWRDLRDSSPDEWADAVAIDAAIRGGIYKTREPLFMHRSLKPLNEVDLSTAEERGQMSLFVNGCEEGMCGV